MEIIYYNKKINKTHIVHARNDYLVVLRQSKWKKIDIFTNDQVLYLLLTSDAFCDEREEKYYFDDGKIIDISIGLFVRDTVDKISLEEWSSKI